MASAKLLLTLGLQLALLKYESTTLEVSSANYNTTPYELSLYMKKIEIGLYEKKESDFLPQTLILCSYFSNSSEGHKQRGVCLWLLLEQFS